MNRFIYAACIVLTVTTAQAQDDVAETGMEGHDMAAMPEGSVMTDASMAYAAANATMHAGMEVPYTGDADVDFVQSMIPHHQGAVDMARIVLEYGKDPDVRAFAEGVIAAQEAEIAWMTEWLATHTQ